MRKHVPLSKRLYTTLALLLLASVTLLGCAPGSTPSPAATPTGTPTQTATGAPKTTTAPAPTSTPANQPQYGGTLRLGYRTEADSLGYPAKLVQAFSVTEAGPAVETLLRFDKTYNTVPWLATAFTNNVAAKTVTLTLGKGIKFHDGTDYNATAVKWNLDQLIAAKTASVRMVGSVDAVDDYTIRLNLTAWDSTVIGNFAQSAGMIVSPTAVKTNGVDWAVKNPVGTGPFKFESWKPGTSISYKKFDGYWQQGKPYLDGVQFVLIADDVTREVSLRAGELDTSVSVITTNLAKARADGFTVAARPTSGGAQALVPDSANPKSPFADVKVRQAAAYAIDNATLAKAVLGEGGAFLTNQLSWPGYWAYNPAVVGYPYDPAKAKQLLTAAGYPNGFKTRIESYNDTQRQSYATGVQGYLKAVGIDAAMDVHTSAQNAELLTGKSWEGLAAGRGGTEPDWVTTMSAWYIGDGNSFVNLLVPADYAQAIRNAISAADFTTKQQFAQEAMKLLIDKYALMIPEYGMVDDEVLWPYVHDTGLYETSIWIWTPEAAWLGKR